MFTIRRAALYIRKQLETFVPLSPHIWLSGKQVACLRFLLKVDDALAPIDRFIDLDRLAQDRQALRPRPAPDVGVNDKSFRLRRRSACHPRVS